jgi:hypothetical protein
MQLSNNIQFFQEMIMTNLSKALALATVLSGAFLVPVQVYAEEGGDSMSAEMSQCLNFALAANDMAAVRDCDRFDPISPIFGKPAAAKKEEK